MASLDLARRVLRNMGEGSAVQAAIAWIQEVAPGNHAGPNTQRHLVARRRELYDAVAKRQPHAPGPAVRSGHDFESASRPEILAGPTRRAACAEFYHSRRSAVAHRRTALEPAGELDHRLGGEQQLCLEPRSRVAVRQVRRITTTVLRPARSPNPLARPPLRLASRPLRRCPLVATQTHTRHYHHTAPSRSPRPRERNPRKTNPQTPPAYSARKTWAAQESLDFDEEQKNLRQEAAADSQPTEKRLSGKRGPRHRRQTIRRNRRLRRRPRLDDATDASEPTAAPTSVESLEAWDAAKHPRGRHAQNAGWFSKAWGRRIACGAPIGYACEHGSARGARSRRRCHQEIFAGRRSAEVKKTTTAGNAA